MAVSLATLCAMMQRMLDDMDTIASDLREMKRSMTNIETLLEAQLAWRRSATARLTARPDKPRHNGEGRVS